jgi:CBS domain-containing protein
VLVDSNVGGAPVVDRAGHAIGMVSKSDLVWEDHDWAESMRALADWQKIGGSKVARDEGLLNERNFASLTVGEVMTRGALSVLPEVAVDEAARLMIANRVHRLSVVNAANTLVGVLTTYDITRWVAERGFA